MHKSAIVTAVLAMGLLGSQVAQATASASASVSNIKYFLVDTNPLDGITASVTFSSISGNNLFTWVNANGQSAYSSWGSLPSSTELDHQGAFGNGLITGTGSLESFVLQASVGSTSGSAYANAQLSFGLTLSEGALLVLIADGSSTAQTTQGSSSAGTESANSSAGIQIYRYSDGANVGSYGNVSAYSSGGQASSIFSNGKATASFINTTGGALELNAYVSAYANASTPITAVPEPQTYALLLAGLGVLAFLQGRRKT